MRIAFMRRLGVVARPVVSVARVALAVSAGLTSGCRPWRDESCPFAPCAPPLHVHIWCRDHPGKCTLDGVEPANCYEGGCKLPVGKTLRVPIALFAGELGVRHQVAASLWPAGNEPGDESKLRVTLDGTLGRPLPALDIVGISQSRFLEFTPFAIAPMVLELLRQDFGNGENWCRVSFVDYACHQANPKPANCGLS